MLRTVVRAVVFLLAVTASGWVSLPSANATADFVTFETGAVRPLALSADGNTLYVVNTPSNQLEIFSIDSNGQLSRTATVGVGLEPVAVAVRSASEVWVVNHLSDSVSILDVGSSPPRVTNTLLVGDEPRDIVFAGSAHDRAFITTAHRGQNIPFDPQLTTPSVGRADVWVFDTNNLGNGLGGTPFTIVTLFADTPRALAATPDGSTVYAAAFHSGNQTTTVTEFAVCDRTNPSVAQTNSCTFNNGADNPTMPGGLPAPVVDVDGVPGPETGLIVKFNPTTSHWEDRLGRDWSNAVRFNLPDKDVFAIDANADATQMQTPTATFTGVGTVLFNMVVHPTNGKVYVSNTDANNDVRFEGPGGGGSTVRGHLAESRITVIDGSNVLPRHLNKQINYFAIPAPPTVKAASLATPTQVILSSDGSTLYVAAFGSNQVGVFNTSQIDTDTFTPNADDHITVPGGLPIGLALHEGHNRLYVLSRFDNAVSNIDLGTRTEEQHVTLNNPEPFSVMSGRRFLYDAQATSSNGEASCSSCHIFGDNDDLAWDLGNPDTTTLPDNNPFTLRVNPPFGPDPNFHSLKGPMTTQTLRGMATHGPLHWRGDRSGANDTGVGPCSDNDFSCPSFDTAAGFLRFNPAFDSLVGLGSQISDDDMQAFDDFIMQVKPPPNPIRNLDNSFTPDQQAGHDFYFNNTVDTRTCNGCHVLDPASGFFGTDGRMSFEGLPQDFKVAHLNNVYTKVGMFGMPVGPGGGSGPMGDQIRGFGVLHDGSVDTVLRFLNGAVFNFPGGDPQRAQVEAFVLAYDNFFAPIVGQQITLTSTNSATVGPRIDLLLQRAAQGECDVAVKGNIGGEPRGAYRLASGLFQLDRAADAPVDDTTLRANAQTAGQELTYTAVPPGTGKRIGVDRDGDGAFDSDERDAGTDPNTDLSLPMKDITCAATTITFFPHLRITHNNKAPGTQGLMLKAQLSLPGATIDPRADGFRFKIQDKDGNDLFYRAVARGDLMSKSGPGWTVNSAKNGWTFTDRTGVSGGIYKITAHSRPGSLFNFNLMAKNSNFQVSPASLPLRFVIIPGNQDDASSDKCGSMTFNPATGARPNCRASSSGATVNCS